MKEFKIGYRELGIMVEEDNLLICGTRLQRIEMSRKGHVCTVRQPFRVSLWQKYVHSFPKYTTQFDTNVYNAFYNKYLQCTGTALNTFMDIEWSVLNLPGQSSSYPYIPPSRVAAAQLCTMQPIGHSLSIMVDLCPPIYYARQSSDQIK